MSTLAEVLAEHHFHAAFGGCVEPCGWQSSEGPDEEREHSAHLAAVVAEWMGSGEAEEVVVAVLEIAMRPDELVYEFQERQARAALAALAAHAKGEAS